MAKRDIITQRELLASVRQSGGTSAAFTASELLTFADEYGLIKRKRSASVSLRIALSPGDRPATLFVIPTTGRFYTYWLDHWPRRYQKVASRYEADLRRLFGKKRVIGPQGARKNTVTLDDVAKHLSGLRRAVVRAIRAIRMINSSGASVPESLVGLEGEVKRRMVLHRKREALLRDARIAQVRNRTGRLACEVKGCGFDFFATYGKVGEDYAHVHHNVPLASRRAAERTTVDDLRVVCANCHAMIHRGGHSRSLASISRALRSTSRIRPN